MSPSYCTTWPSLVLARIRFLLDHVSSPSCSTCQFSIGTHVMLWLDHVSLLHWTMCHIFIGPRGYFLFDHESRCCPSTFRIFIQPYGYMTSFHVSDFNGPRVVSWLFYVSCTGLSMCCIFILSCGLSWFYRVVYNQFFIEVI